MDSNSNDSNISEDNEKQNKTNGVSKSYKRKLDGSLVSQKNAENVVMPDFNLYLKDSGFINFFRQNWIFNTDLCYKYVNLYNNPFKVCVVDNFLQDEAILEEIQKEFANIVWQQRSMDLYEFYQSEDLKNFKNMHKNIENVYQFFKNDVKKWIEKISEYKLDKISATCSIYSKNDYLLVHDDLQEDRLIAFIYYITPFKTAKWTQNHGGVLELFNKDKNGLPLNPVKQIVPKSNRFVFFEVSNSSYHQVTEVLGKNFSRLSINGWFHSKSVPPKKTSSLAILNNEKFLPKLKPLIVDFPLDFFLNADYLKPEIKTQIHQQIENESEICLKNFFKNDIYAKLCTYINSDDVTWIKQGPPNRRKYEVADEETMPNNLKGLIYVFQSETMFRILQEYTGLEFNFTNIQKNKSTVQIELQRWSPGCYSLFSDFEHKENDFQLELFLYFGCEDKCIQVIGGHTLYVDIKEDIAPALINIRPKANSLNLVYSDVPKTVKYISKQSLDNYFYTLYCIYKE